MKFGRRIKIDIKDLAGERVMTIPSDQEPANRLRIGFVVDRDETGAGHYADIMILNLSKKTRERLSKGTETGSFLVDIYAGYGDDSVNGKGAKPMFTGYSQRGRYYSKSIENFAFGEHTRHGRTDTSTRIILTSAYGKHGSKIDPDSAVESGTIDQTIRGMATRNGDYGAFEDFDIPPELGSIELDSPFTPGDNVMISARELSAPHGYEPFADGDTLRFRRAGEYRGIREEAVEYKIDQSTGMIGIPHYVDSKDIGGNITMESIVVESLMIPHILIGDVVKLKSEHGGNLNGIEGDFIVTKVAHKGDNADGDFKTTLTLAKIYDPDEEE